MYHFIELALVRLEVFLSAKSSYGALLAHAFSGAADPPARSTQRLTRAVFRAALMNDVACETVVHAGDEDGLRSRGAINALGARARGSRTEAIPLAASIMPDGATLRVIEDVRLQYTRLRTIFAAGAAPWHKWRASANCLLAGVAVARGADAFAVLPAAARDSGPLMDRVDTKFHPVAVRVAAAVVCGQTGLRGETPAAFCGTDARVAQMLPEEVVVYTEGVTPRVDVRGALMAAAAGGESLVEAVRAVADVLDARRAQRGNRQHIVEALQGMWHHTLGDLHGVGQLDVEAELQTRQEVSAAISAAAGVARGRVAALAQAEDAAKRSGDRTYNEVLEALRAVEEAARDVHLVAPLLPRTARLHADVQLVARLRGELPMLSRRAGTRSRGPATRRADEHPPSRRRSLSMGDIHTAGAATVGTAAGAGPTAGVRTTRRTAAGAAADAGTAVSLSLIHI